MVQKRKRCSFAKEKEKNVLDQKKKEGLDEYETCPYELMKLEFDVLDVREILKLV